MSTLEILNLSSEAFKPGEVLSGSVRWNFPEPQDELELRLLWYTKGKGSEDVEVVKSEAFDNPGSSGERPFQLVLPNSPYSFSGKLISLLWVVELVAEPSGDSIHKEIVIAPSKEEIQLRNASARPS